MMREDMMLDISSLSVGSRKIVIYTLLQNKHMDTKS